MAPLPHIPGSTPPAAPVGKPDPSEAPTQPLVNDTEPLVTENLALNIESPEDGSAKEAIDAVMATVTGSTTIRQLLADLNAIENVTASVKD